MLIFPVLFLHWQANSFPLASPGKPYMVQILVYVLLKWAPQLLNIKAKVICLRSLFFKNFFLAVPCGTLVLWPGIGSTHPAVEVQNLNHCMILYFFLIQVLGAITFKYCFMANYNLCVFFSSKILSIVPFDFFFDPWIIWRCVMWFPNGCGYCWDLSVIFFSFFTLYWGTAD